MEQADDPLDLSGRWQGVFSYPIAREPTPFTATLSEEGGWFTGTTQEIAAGGEAAGLDITATLQGRRTGAAVTFLKTYDDALSNYSSVQYAGQVSADGAEIEGRWTVHASWSGPFLMIRSGGASDLVAVELAAEA